MIIYQIILPFSVNEHKELSIKDKDYMKVIQIPHINSSLKIKSIYAAIAANSTSSLKSLSFNLLFGLMPDTQINRSSR